MRELVRTSADRSRNGQRRLRKKEERGASGCQKKRATAAAADDSRRPSGSDGRTDGRTGELIKNVVVHRTCRDRSGLPLRRRLGDAVGAQAQPRLKSWRAPQVRGWNTYAFLFLLHRSPSSFRYCSTPFLPFSSVYSFPLARPLNPPTRSGDVL